MNRGGRGISGIASCGQISSLTDRPTMVALKALLSVLAEYFKSVFVNRRWTVMTASLFIVAGIQWLFNHLSSLPERSK
jgi:hypothetical protein